MIFTKSIFRKNINPALVQDDVIEFMSLIITHKNDELETSQMSFLKDKKLPQKYENNDVYFFCNNLLNKINEEKQKKLSVNDIWDYYLNNKDCKLFNFDYYMDISKYQLKYNLKTVDKFITDILNEIHPNKSLSKEVKLLLNKYVQRVVQHYNEYYDGDNEKYCNTYIRDNLAKHGFSEMIRKSASSKINSLNIEVNDECKYLIEYIMEEMIELSGNTAYTLNKTRINVLHVLIAIMDDDELSHQPFLLK
jgi:hypothetical protein